MSARMLMAATALDIRTLAALTAAEELLADVVEANKKKDPRPPAKGCAGPLPKGHCVMTSTAPLHATPRLVPALMPMGISKGKPTEKILFNNVTGEYHCAECDFAGPTFHHILGHKRTSHPSKPRARREPTGWDAVYAELLTAVRSIDDAMQKIGDMREQEKDETWKVRALTAERSLASLRKILRPDETATP